MRQILLVTSREFLVQVKKKSFLLLTLATPLLMVGLFALVFFLTKANQETNNIAIVDESGLFTTTFKSDAENRFAFYDPSELTALKDTLADSEYLQGILYIPKTDSTFKSLEKGIELSSNKSVGIGQISSLQRKISDKLESLNLAKKGVSNQDLKDAEVPVQISVKKESDSGSSETDQVGEGVKMGLSYILMYAIFMFIMIYGVRVMRSVIEEKNNRVVEIIISSVKPFNLMMGKILGTTLVALTQFTIWIAIIIVVMTIFPAVFGSGLEGGQDMSAITENTNMSASITENVQTVIDTLFGLNIPLIVVSFLAYFFFGYLFYSAFFAAIGASVDSETETQQFMWVGLAPLMVGVYGAVSIINNPDGPVGFWMSMIPFTSPVSMMARISYGVPAWQLALSLLILIGSVVGMVWFASKIYRVGILMHGKKPSFKEWMKWIKY